MTTALMSLPIPLTRLLGRADELARARHLLLDAGVRLLTFTGPPGTGKTRLALELAEHLQAAYENGVRWVHLAPVTDAGWVTAAIAQALGVPEQPAQSLLESLAAAVGDRHLLLVLDNFEQVLDAAPVVAGLLARCPRLHVLATSRAPLRIRGEREFPVSPLALPEPEAFPSTDGLERYAAVALFAERARDVQPDFALAGENATAVAEICRRLDGLPLAIELAAVRSKALPPAAMLARMERRLPLLTGGARDVPRRQQTLHDAIAWSYDLLSPGEQALLRRVAVFAGSFTLEAAEAVAEQTEAIDDIVALVDHSLLNPAPGIDFVARYHLLETIREYALTRSIEEGEADHVRRQHASFFLALAEDAAKHLHGPDQAIWLDRLEQDHHNLRAALRWAIEQGERGTALRLCVALWWYWLVRGHFSEGRELLAGALALSPSLASSADGNASVEALIGAGYLGEMTETLVARGLLAEYQNNDPAASTLVEEGLASARSLGNERLVALALIARALMASHRGSLDQARTLLDEAVSSARAAGNHRLIAWSLNTLGHNAYQRREYDAARSRFEQALAIRRTLGDEWGIATTLNDLGHLSFIEQDYAGARTYYQQSLAIRRRIGHRPGIVLSLAGLGRVANAEGDHAQARALWEESLTASPEWTDIRYSWLWHGAPIQISDSTQGKSANHFSAAARAALSLLGSMGADRQPPQVDFHCYTFARLSSFAAAQGRWCRAARLAGAAIALRTRLAWSDTLFRQAQIEQCIAPVRQAIAEGRAGTREAWAEGQTMTPSQAVEYALSDVDDDGDDDEADPAEATNATPDAEPLAAANTAPERSRSNPLTPREREVASLIAQGLTNRQIAEQLVISHRTAMRHVEHILSKLGVHSRAQIAAWVTRQEQLAG
jgi:predicted ATPase/DNA-binding NarL/FixJ family response regulator/Tfp pilus assembly protein PilF